MQDSTATHRHSAMAWACAVALSAAILGARFDSGPVVLPAFAFLVAATALWVVKRVSRRLARSLPAASSTGIVTLQACAWLGLLALWLWTAAILVPAFLIIYPEPAMNRMFAESLGVELGPLLFAALGACVAVTAAAIPVIRAFGDPAPEQSRTLSAFCLCAPPACLLLAMAPYAYMQGWESAWTSMGADLPAPTLFFQAAGAYWGFAPALALAISAIAWAMRHSAVLFTRLLFAQLAVVMLCSAWFSAAAVAAWLPTFKMCGAV